MSLIYFRNYLLSCCSQNLCIQSAVQFSRYRLKWLEGDAYYEACPGSKDTKVLNMYNIFNLQKRHCELISCT